MKFLKGFYFLNFSSLLNHWGLNKVIQSDLMWNGALKRNSFFAGRVIRTTPHRTQGGAICHKWRHLGQTIVAKTTRRDHAAYLKLFPINNCLWGSFVTNVNSPDSSHQTTLNDEFNTNQRCSSLKSIKTILSAGVLNQRNFLQNQHRVPKLNRNVYVQFDINHTETWSTSVKKCFN